jgi:hypothetical protein
MSDWQEFLLRPALRRDYFLQRASFKMFLPPASTKCHNGGLSFCCRGMGIVGKDAMTVPDYLAVGFLLVMPLIAARWFAQRKFELFPTGSDTQRRSP